MSVFDEKDPHLALWVKESGSIEIGYNYIGHDQSLLRVIQYTEYGPRFGAVTLPMLRWMMPLPPWRKPLLNGARSKALRWGKSNSFIRREDFRTLEVLSGHLRANLGDTLSRVSVDSLAYIYARFSLVPLLVESVIVEDDAIAIKHIIPTEDNCRLLPRGNPPEKVQFEIFTRAGQVEPRYFREYIMQHSTRVFPVQMHLFGF